MQKKEYPRLFFVILIIKLIAINIFMPELYVNWFVPFIKNFIHSGYQNPWNYFLEIGGDSRAFPYGPGMLFFFSIPFALKSIVVNISPEIVTHADIFLMSIPIIFADYFIYYILVNSLELDEIRTLYIYWCSPVAFYISYYFGQLDVVPMFLMFASAVLLLKKRFAYSAIIFAIGLATKENLFIAMPFLLIYVFNKGGSRKKFTFYLALLSVCYFLLIAGFVNSPGYQEMVFGAKEKTWVFMSKLRFGDYELLLFPLGLAMLYLKFALYQKLNHDIFIMYLGMAFTLVLLFVPAATPGWYMWLIPFLCYFFINTQNTQKLHSALPVLFSILFIVFFMVKTPYPLNLIKPDSVSALSMITGDLLSKSTHNLIVNITFTFFQGIIAYITAMMYFYGVRSNDVYKIRTGPLVIGIGGNSGSGKDTLANSLKKLFGENNIIQTDGDDHHKWERGHDMWKAVTHLNPIANDLFLQFDHAYSLRRGKTVYRRFYNHETGKFSSPNKIESNKYIVVSGLHPFYLKRMRDLIDIKVYLDTEKDLRNYWKIKRDVHERKYNEKEVQKKIVTREEDGLKYIEPQKEFADVIIRYEPIDKPTSIDIIDDNAIRVKLISDNSINYESMLENLKNIPSLNVSHWYEDAYRQCIAIEGNIDAESIKRIGHMIIPQINELIDSEIQYENGLKGVVQLAFLVLLNYKETYDRN